MTWKIYCFLSNCYVTVGWLVIVWLVVAAAFLLVLLLPLLSYATCILCRGSAVYEKNTCLQMLMKSLTQLLDVLDLKQLHIDIKILLCINTSNFCACGSLQN
jgi:hypothetical protein